MSRETLCDVCLEPGACCKRLHLTGFSEDPLRQPQLPMSHERAEHFAMSAGLPFRPLEQNERGVWLWECTALLPNGRCSIYEDRPELCRAYKPGSDPLCVHHVPRPDSKESFLDG